MSSGLNCPLFIKVVARTCVSITQAASPIKQWFSQAYLESCYFLLTSQSRASGAGEGRGKGGERGRRCSAPPRPQASDLASCRAALANRAVTSFTRSLNLSRVNIHLLSCTRHISSTQLPHVMRHYSIEQWWIEVSHHSRKFYRTAPSKPQSPPLGCLYPAGKEEERVWRVNEEGSSRVIFPLNSISKTSRFGPPYCKETGTCLCSLCA